MWLVAIVTVPWNVYFDAKEVASEAAISQDKGIPVDSKQLTYVNNVSRGALLIAIALHLFSALGLYELANMGISLAWDILVFCYFIINSFTPGSKSIQY